MNNKPDYIENIEGAERRFVQTQMTKVETRNDEKIGTVIEGVAAVVGRETDLGWFREQIAVGAFDDALKDPEIDCRCLFNHDANLILARRSATSDSLELFTNENGDLAFRYVTPNRSFAKDLADAISNGDVSQCSFGFTVSEQRWIFDDEGKESDLRIIEKVDRLHDVGPVTYPAYSDTSVAERSMKSVKKDIRPKVKTRLANAQLMFNKNNTTK